MIQLKWSTRCRDCGTPLLPGDQARYYGRNRVYGVECHDRDGVRTPWGEQRSQGSQEERGPESPQDGRSQVQEAQGPQATPNAQERPSLVALAQDLVGGTAASRR